jgi:hypothetical protein
MKLSISIPDDLWLKVHRPGEPNSQTVQEALRMLAETRNPSSSALVSLAGTAYDGSDPATVQTLEQGLAQLAKEAADVQRIGYTVGLEAAVMAPWSDIERLASGHPQLDTQLYEVIFEAGEVGEAVRGALEQWGDQVDFIWDADAEEYVFSPTFFHGLARAFIEVRTEIHRRLNAAKNAPVVVEEQD